MPKVCFTGEEQNSAEDRRMISINTLFFIASCDNRSASTCEVADICENVFFVVVVSKNFKVRFSLIH